MGNRSEVSIADRREAVRSLLRRGEAASVMARRLYRHPQHARECLAEFRARYNERRAHWALIPEQGGDVLVPIEVYLDGRKIQIPCWRAWARAAQAKLEEMMEDAA